MAGSVRNRVLAVLRILIRNTDEDKTLTTPELIELLNGQGITADRRSIYEDIEAINNAGWEVLRSDTGKRGYYFASRQFDDAELGMILHSLYSFPPVVFPAAEAAVPGANNYQFLPKNLPVSIL